MQAARAIRVAGAVVPWMVAIGALLLLDPQIPPRGAPSAPGGAFAPPVPPVAAPAPKKLEVLFEPWEHVST